MDAYYISKEESDRLNILKYIAIVFVLYIHAYATEVNFADGTNKLFLPEWLVLFENLVSQVIARCGVPIFFVISSILLFKSQRDYGKTLKKKVKTLLIPYLFWNTFWILVFIVLQSLSFTAPFFSGGKVPIMQSSLSQWLGLYGIGLECPYPQDYPLWFMRDLIVITLFFPIIGKVAYKFPRLFLIAIITLLLMPVTFPFKTGMLWFGMGACIVKLQIHITALDRISMWSCSLLYAILTSAALMIDNNIIDSLFIFVGIAYWARVSKCIYDSTKVRRIFLVLSEWTFIIYVLHELTLSSLKKVCFRMMPTEPIWLLMEYIILPIVVIGGCSIVGAMLKKGIPKLYGVLTGER